MRAGHIGQWNYSPQPQQCKATKVNPPPDLSHVGDIDDPTVSINPEASEATGKDEEKRSGRFRRIKLIHQLLRSKGFITFADFKRIAAAQSIPEATRETFHADVDALNYLLDAVIKEAKFEDGSLGYFLSTRRIETTKRQREQFERSRKEVIARLAGGLLLGEHADHLPTAIAPLLQADLLKRLRAQSSQTANQHAEIIIRKLQDQAWRHLQRQIAVDSGTTNEVFCSEILSGLALPRPALNRLIVCTNSRAIFNILGVPGVPIKTIIVGGQQLFQTESIAGNLAEQFLKATNLSFSMSFIGATVVDLRNMVLGGDYDADSAIKSELLSRSEIRVVMADRSKFMTGPYAAYNRFAMISPTVVDLIITDEIDHEHMDKINKMGVPVLAMNIIHPSPPSGETGQKEETRTKRGSKAGQRKKPPTSR